jgi:ABC-type Co2+ transport system permease subunit
MSFAFVLQNNAIDLVGPVFVHVCLLLVVAIMVEVVTTDVK